MVLLEMISGLVLVEMVDRLIKGVLVEIVSLFLLVFPFCSVSLITFLFALTSFLRLFDRILFFLCSSCISSSPCSMVLEAELASYFKVLFSVLISRSYFLRPLTSSLASFSTFKNLLISTFAFSSCMLSSWLAEANASLYHSATAMVNIEKKKRTFIYNSKPPTIKIRNEKYYLSKQEFDSSCFFCLCLTLTYPVKIINIVEKYKRTKY